MTFRRYTLSVLTLIILLALTPAFFVWVWHKHYMIVTLITLSVLWFVEIAYLFYFLRRVSREMKQFLSAFEYNDSTIKYTQPSNDPILKDLYLEFDRLIDAFRDVKLKKERELIFYKQAAEQAGVGLIAISESGNIKLINKAFTSLFDLPKLNRINQLKGIDERLYDFIEEVKPGKEIIKLTVANQLRHIAAKTVLFTYEENVYKLIAFQDIKNEIDQTELDAWQKLIRILRHEIHNSLSPITFLSSGLIKQIKGDLDKSGDLSQTVSKGIIEGLEMIRKRSISLSEFVENYKKLTDLPIPSIQPISASKFLGHIDSLFRSESIERGINFTINQPKQKLVLYIDEKLIEQAIINIISNALEAVQDSENGSVWVNLSVVENSEVISISNNGAVIPDELLENIFTPFFTTKKNGSGIGLSLSRQIMRLHNGTLTATSKLDTGTTFYMRF